MAADQPTPLWADNPATSDLLGFADIAEPILEAVGRDKLDPVAVGVFGDWGSGKSTVLELIRERLAADEGVVVVYTRPWEYDPNTDPKATLIAEVLDAVQKVVDAQKSRADKVGERLKSLAKRIQWAKAISLAANTAVTFSPPVVRQGRRAVRPEGGWADRADAPGLPGRVRPADGRPAGDHPRRRTRR